MIQSASVTSPVDTTSRFESEVRDSASPIHLLTERVWSSARVVWWGAIVAGAVAAMAIQIIFALLGTAIGLTVAGNADNAPARDLSVAGAVYWLITGLVSLFIGGMIASRLRSTCTSGVAAAHGFLTWCTVTVVSALLLALAGGAAIGGSLSVMGDAMAGTNRGQQLAAQPLRSTAANANESDVTPVVSEADARQAARNAARASWWTLAALLLGAGVASIGGAVGVHRMAADDHPRSTVGSTGSRGRNSHAATNHPGN